MPYIIVRGSLHKTPPSGNWKYRKDYLHKRRKELSERIKEGIMSKSEMNRGEEGEPVFDTRVEQYDKWKKEKEPLMQEWNQINREFKKQGEEGKPMSIDVIRDSTFNGKNIKYE